MGRADDPPPGAAEGNPGPPARPSEKHATLTDLEQVREGAFIAAVEASTAAAPDRVRAAAERAWAIAGAIGALLLTIAFTRVADDGTTSAKVTIILAIGAWLLAAGAFLLVAAPLSDSTVEKWRSEVALARGWPPGDEPDELAWARHDAFISMETMWTILATRTRAGVTLSGIAALLTLVTVAQLVFWPSDPSETESSTSPPKPQ